MRTLYLLSVWVHVISAIVWIGGSVFLALILVPAMRQTEHRGVAASIVSWTGRRLRTIGWICFGLFIVTGTYNLGFRGYTWGDLFDGSLFAGPFGETLGIKLIIFVIILILSAIHDFYVGPKATALMREDPRSDRARKLRRGASWFGRLNLLLALIVVFLGVMLVRGGF